MRLLAKTGRVTQGSITFDGRDLLALSAEEMREIRGRDISMIFQEPMTSLNPVLSIGEQVMEPLLIHLKMTRGPGARARGGAAAARRHHRRPAPARAVSRIISPAACASA